MTIDIQGYLTSRLDKFITAIEKIANSYERAVNFAEKMYEESKKENI